MASSVNRTRWRKSVLGAEVPHSEVWEFFVPDDYAPGPDEPTVIAAGVAEMRERGRDIHLSEDGGKSARRVGVLGAIDHECNTVLYAVRADPDVLSPEEFGEFLATIPGPPGWAKRYFAAEIQRLMERLPTEGGVQ